MQKTMSLEVCLYEEEYFQLIDVCEQGQLFYDSQPYDIPNQLKYISGTLLAEKIREMAKALARKDQSDE